MASLAIAAVIVGAAGQAISAITQAGALRAQARAREIEGEQELLASKRQLRQELGQAAVSVGASGLLGASFAGVFESQAILDAEFLGQIQQRTDFDVENLKRAATVTLITGLTGAGASAAGGIAGARMDAATLAAAQREAERQKATRLASKSIFPTGSSQTPFRRLALKGSPFQ